MALEAQKGSKDLAAEEAVEAAHQALKGLLAPLAMGEQQEEVGKAGLAKHLVEQQVEAMLLPEQMAGQVRKELVALEI